ncbi:MAG: hypothetical protein IAG13_05560, partial [Deltaproteobacteria bacterium]|nr:hypothetical protein [Nannocystaceae bacterium]
EPLSDGSPAPAKTGLQLARLGFEGVQLRRDHGPTEDGMPRVVRLDGAVTIDERSDIDWQQLVVAIDGARLDTSGRLLADSQALRGAEIDLVIDDGAAFARALDLPHYIDDARLHMLFAGPLSRPSGSAGKLRVVTTGAGLSGPTEAALRLDDGVLRLVSEDARLLGGRGRIELDVHLFERGGLASDPKLRAYVRLDGVDLGAASEGVVGGIADVELEVGDGDGKPARVSELRIGGTATAKTLRYGGSEYTGATLAFHWTAEELAIDQLVLPLRRRTSTRVGATEIEVGRIVADGTIGLVGDPALDLHVAAEGLPLDVVAALLEAKLPLRGQIGAGTELDVGGTVSRPSVEGKVALVGLSAFGIPLGNGTLEVESEDAPAEGSLAAHRELWAKGELSTGDREGGRVDWSVDAVVAIGKPSKRGGSPSIEAQLDVGFDQLALPLLLRATKMKLPGLEGQLEGLAAHVLSCDVGTAMLSDCAMRPSGERKLAIAVTLDRAWLRASPRSSVVRAQRDGATDPCTVAGTLCANGLAATLDGDSLRLDRPLQLRSPEGTAAELAGAFDLTTPGAATATDEALDA